MADFTPSTAIPVGGIPAKFDYGTITLPLSMQSKSAGDVYDLLQTIVHDCSCAGMTTGNVVSGVDLGRLVCSPAPPVIGIAYRRERHDAGEVWHLLDQRLAFGFCTSNGNLSTVRTFGRYNTPIMVGGNWQDSTKDKLKGLGTGVAARYY